MTLKQVIVVRSDIRMGKGKLATQVAHASLGAYRKASKTLRESWEKSGEKKVVLKANSEKEILELYRKARELKLPCFLVKDAGLTQLPPGTITALGIGPEEEEKIDEVTGHLKLL